MTMIPYVFKSSNLVNDCEKSPSNNINCTGVASNEGGRRHIANAAVIFDSRYGNTEKIAKSLEAGLKQANITTTVCVNAEYVNNDLLKDCDLICIDAPTHFLSASKSIKQFLAKMKGIDLSGKVWFFDTKFDSRMSGSAAKFIERELNKLYLDIIAPRESAIVFGQKEKEGGAGLKEGEEKRFEQIGFRLGSKKAEIVNSSHSHSAG